MRLEVEVVDRVLRIRVLELVVADGDEHRQRQAGGRERREERRVVELLVDRVDEQALAEPEGAELARAGVARRDRDVDRGAEHDRRTEEIRVRERVAKRAVAAHRVAGDAAPGAVRDGSVGAVHVRDQVLRERRLDLAARIGARVARVDVVAGAAAPGRVGHDRDRRLDLARGDQRVERALHLRPGALRVAAAVKEVENRVAVGRPLVSGRQVDVVRDRLVERCRLEAPLGQRSLGGGVCADGRRRRQDEQQRRAGGECECESVLHRSPLGCGRGDVPYDSASATICRAAPSIAASTNSPPASVPAPAASSRSTVAWARATSSSVGR